MVVGCVAPAAGAVLVVVGPAALVLLDHIVRGLPEGEVVALHEAVDAGVGVTADEDGDQAGMVGQGGLGTAAHHDEGVAGFGLLLKPGGLNGEHAGLHGVVQHGVVPAPDAPSEEVVSRGLLVLAKGFLVQVAVFGDLGEEILVVHGQIETLGQLFGDLVAAAAGFTADGNDELLHGASSLVQFSPIMTECGEKSNGRDWKGRENQVVSVVISEKISKIFQTKEETLRRLFFHGRLCLLSTADVDLQEVHGAVDPQLGGVDGQMVVGGVPPAAGAVLVMVSPAASVLLGHVVGSLPGGEVVALHEPVDAGVRVAGDEDGHQTRVVGQDALGAAAHDDEGVSPGGLGPQAGGLEGGDRGLHRVAHAAHAAAEEPASGSLLVFAQGLLIQISVIGDLGEQVVVVQGQVEALGQLFGDLMAAAAGFTADGDDELLHGRTSFDR